MRYLLYILVSTLLQAFAYGYVAKNYSGEFNFQFYFMVFSICSLFYISVSYRSISKGFGGAGVKILQLNVFTAITFLAFFLSLTFIPASVSSLIEASVGPIVAVGVSRLLLDDKAKRSDVVCAFLLFFILFGSSFMILDRSGLSVGFFLGAGLSLVAGAAAAVIAVISRGLGLEGINSESVLALRFILAALVSLGFVLLFGKWTWDIGFIATAFSVGFFGIVLPMFLLQQAMQKIKPIFSMIALSAIPGVTYLSEVFLGSKFDNSIFFLMLVCVISSVAYVVFSSRRLPD